MLDRFLDVNKMNARNQKIVHTKRRNELEPPGTGWNELGLSGTTWNELEQVRTSWNELEPSRKSWNDLFEIDIFFSIEGIR